VFEGDFNGDGSLECSGDFAGTIDIAGDLVIGHGGTTEADVKARNITVEGRLKGAATGAEKVEVGPFGHVEGDVSAPSVQFSEGAFFEGNVEMRRAEAEAATADEANDSPGGKPAQQGGGTPAA
jgi:cytoskeletal protein CcmA (bactofilin family)